jgi:hypothetical protein
MSMRTAEGKGEHACISWGKIADFLESCVGVRLGEAAGICYVFSNGK